MPLANMADIPSCKVVLDAMGKLNRVPIDADGMVAATIRQLCLSVSCTPS